MENEESIYVDSRGTEMPAMAWSEALRIVHDLASQNQLEDSHVAGDKNLESLRDWQQTALDTLESMIDNREEEINSLPPSSEAGDWSDAAWRAERSMEASEPSSAIRICYDLAQDAAIDPQDADGVEMADEIDRQQQAFDLARDLLGMHTSAVSALAASPRP